MIEKELREMFASGPVRTPLCLRGDAYTVASHKIVSPKAKQRSVYNFTNRRSPVEAWPSVSYDSRMVLYGVTDFIRNELTQRDTPIDVLLAQEYMKTAHSFGGSLDFDFDMWNKITTKRGGWLPIRIRGLREGSTFWPNEPVVQVESLEEGYGEVAAIIEALLVGYVSCGTARATMTRHLLERIRDKVEMYNPDYTKEQIDSVAQWMVHDFGMRASSTGQESAMYGRAHLLSFNGTDTFHAAYQAWHDGASRPIGTSILALAHRIVMGFTTEQEAYEAIYQASLDSGGIGSYVADCYDFHEAVRNFIVGIAKRGGATAVARPDSGSYLENVLFIVKEAMKAGLYKFESTDTNHRRPIPTTLKFVQGDSMTWDKMVRVFDGLDNYGVNPTAWGIFGVGGWLRNSVNRDSLSSAYKLSAMGLDNEPTVKLSDTFAKISIPGPNVVLRGHREEMLAGPTVLLESEYDPSDTGMPSEYVTYYDGSKMSNEAYGDACIESFDITRNRCLSDFDEYAYMKMSYGLHDKSPLSARILDLQRETMEAHGKKISDYRF